MRDNQKIALLVVVHHEHLILFLSEVVTVGFYRLANRSDSPRVVFPNRHPAPTGSDRHVSQFHVIAEREV
jgi:hypothetical protein